MQGAMSCTGSSKESFRSCEHALLPPYMPRICRSVKIVGLNELSSNAAKPSVRSPALAAVMRETGNRQLTLLQPS